MKARLEQIVNVPADENCSVIFLRNREKRKKSAQIKVLIFQYVAFLTWLFYILIRLTFNLSMFMVPIFNASPLARCPTVSSGISRT